MDGREFSLQDLGEDLELCGDVVVSDQLRTGTAITLIFIHHYRINLGAVHILRKQFYRLVQHRMYSILLCVSL